MWWVEHDQLERTVVERQVGEVEQHVGLNTQRPTVAQNVALASLVAEDNI